MALLREPGQTGQALDELHRLIEEYPYFHTGHVLYLKALQQADPQKMTVQLQATALSVRDRELLYQYIHRPLFQTDIQKTVQKETVQEVAKDADADFPAREIASVVHSQEKIMDSNQLLNELLRNDAKRPSHAEVEQSSDSAVFSEQQLVADLKKISRLRSDSADAPQEEPAAFSEPATFSEPAAISEPAAESVAERDDRVWTSSELIDFFLKANPKIVPKDSDYEVDLSESMQESHEIATETLADIYASQGHKDKAIAIYEQLILKYPQKNIYFAAQINRLKK